MKREGFLQDEVVDRKTNHQDLTKIEIEEEIVTFWLKILVQGPHCFGVVGQVHFGSSFFCVSVKTDRSHGPQGMVGISHSFRVVAWTTSTIHTIATSFLSGPLLPRSRRVTRSAGGSEATKCGGIPKCRRQHGLGSSDWRVLGEGDSAEIGGLQAALKEARRAAQDRPLAAQVEECQTFIHRSQRRLQCLQEEQVKEQQQLNTALARMKVSRGDSQDDRARPNS